MSLVIQTSYRMVEAMFPAADPRHVFVWQDTTRNSHSNQLRKTSYRNLVRLTVTAGSTVRISDDGHNAESLAHMLQNIRDTVMLINIQIRDIDE